MKDIVEPIDCGWMIRLGYLCRKEMVERLNRADHAIPISITFEPQEEAVPAELQIVDAALRTSPVCKWYLDEDSKKAVRFTISLLDEPICIELYFVNPEASQANEDVEELFESLEVTLILQVNEGKPKTYRYLFARSNEKGHTVPPLQWVKSE